MNSELMKKMKQVAKAAETLFGKTSSRLVRYDTLNDIAYIGRESNLNFVKRTDTHTGKSVIINADIYLWAIRRSGTTLLKLCNDNKDEMQVAVEHNENIAFFRIEGEQLEPLTRHMARLMAASL